MAAATQEFCRLALGLSWYQALAVALAAAPLGALWLFACQRLRPGAARLLAVAPLVAVNLVLPRLFCRWTDINTTVIASFAIAWLCSFKVGELCFPVGGGCRREELRGEMVAMGRGAGFKA